MQEGERGYDAREFEKRPWFKRYPAWAEGADAWREIDVRSKDVASTLLDELIRRRRRRKVGPARPCVFVSHRRSDHAPALRIAWLACQRGFDYWLDVLDPVLTGSPPPPPLLAALIIEMGLLNSTHVVAVITSKSAGSEWIPYEYGRVKEPVLVSAQAACWISPKDPPSGPIPEYLYLGAITEKSESAHPFDLGEWLEAQHLAYTKSSHGTPCGWTGGTTTPL